MRIGFDVDGVLTKTSVVKSSEDCLNAERSDLEVPQSDGHEAYVVSARSEDVREETERWLAENGVVYEKLVLYDGGDFESLSVPEIDKAQAEFKAEMIDELDLDVFVEDRPDVRKQLRNTCSSCVIIHPGRIGPNFNWRDDIHELDV